MHDDYEAENGPKRKLARRMGSFVSKPGGILMLNSGTVAVWRVAKKQC